MVKRIGTTQRKTHDKYKLDYRQKGKLSLSRYFQQFQDGDKVGLKINSSVQEGRFFSRFHGQVGTISGQRGACYKVTINDKGKKKDLFVHPIHLIKLEA